VPIPDDQPMKAKVPISRLAHHSNCIGSGRVSRACENCREQKAKCSGHRPSCHRCHKARVKCLYGYRKREKILKCVFFFRTSDFAWHLTWKSRQLEELTTRVHTYVNLLRDLYPRLDASSAQNVHRVLGDQLNRVSIHDLRTSPSPTTIPRLVTQRYTT
jgi:hypothetical protein